MLIAKYCDYWFSRCAEEKRKVERAKVEEEEKERISYLVIESKINSLKRALALWRRVKKSKSITEERGEREWKS